MIIKLDSWSSSMKPFFEYSAKDNSFWANVKFISEKLGYSDRTSKGQRLRRYNLDDITKCYREYGLNLTHIYNENEKSPTEFSRDLVSYLNRRNRVIETNVEPNLMNREEVEVEFIRIREYVNPTCTLPMNK